MLPRTPDEIGMYLRKIAGTPLLDRDHEAEIAEKVCRTRRTFLTGLLANDYSLRLVLAAARKAAQHKLRIDYVVDLQGIDPAARQEAYHRLDAGVKVLQAALRRNRRDRRPPATGSNRPKGGKRPGCRFRVAAVRPLVEFRSSSSRSPC